MEKQSYKNHIRFYPPHHFVFYPVIAVLLGVAVYFVVASSDKLLWAFICLLFVAIIYVSYMMRQHYALTLQNRIIRLEMRYRYFALTGKRFEDLETGLRDSQVFALRFCPDEELESMTQRAFSEKLSATKIKEAIANWKGDYNRV